MKKMIQDRKTNFYGFLILVMAGVLMLSDCGRQNRGAEEPLIRYAAAFTDLEFPRDAYTYSNSSASVLCGRTMDEKTGEVRFYKKDLNEDAPVVEIVPYGKVCEATEEIERCLFCVDEDGHLYVIWEIISEQYEMQYFLCKYDEDGQVLIQKDVTEQIVNAEKWTLKGIVIDDAERIYIVCDFTILLYDRDGEYQGEVADSVDRGSIWAYGKGRDGKVYYTKYPLVDSGEWKGEWELVEVDFEGRKKGATYKGYPEVFEGIFFDHLIAGVQHDFLVSDGGYLYGYQMESQTLEKIFKWSDVEISGKDVICLCEQENGDILAVESMTSKLLVRLTETEEEKEKIIITLGGVAGQNYEELEKKIIQFNRIQDEYRVELKTYGESWDFNNLNSNIESKDGMQAMTLELVSGKGPDLIAYNGNFPIYAEKGMLEDLNEYLEKSAVLSREDYLESALDMFTFDDKLVAIPTYFTLPTLYGYTDQVGEERGRSIREFLGLIREDQEMALLDVPDSINLFIFLCRPLVSSFIDWDNKTCFFNSEEFRRLLKFAKDAPKVRHVEGAWAEGYWPELGTDYLLATGNISNVTGTIGLLASQREITFIGYPIEEGEGTYLHVYTNQYNIGISSQSQHKEGAWKFLEYLYSTVGEGNPLFYIGLPAKKSYLAQYLNDLVGTKLTVDGEEYSISEDDIEFIRDMIKNAIPDRINLYANTVCDIIYEEAEAYFKGDKPIEEVTKIIQNRVRLYLNEGL